MNTIEQAYEALDAAWNAHQVAIDSGNQSKISKASKAIKEATIALRIAENHAAMNAAKAGR